MKGQVLLRWLLGYNEETQPVILLVHLPCHLRCLPVGYTKKTCFRTVHLREEGKVFGSFSSPAGGQLP